MSEEISDLLPFFSPYQLTYEVPEGLVRPFWELAMKIAEGPQNAESVACVRKLLEAKDCAVRAVQIASMRTLT
jgi:hypothetical protein